MKNNNININQAVIFAGGEGTRLRPITNNIPKPLAPIDGRPFLDYLFKSLEDIGISKILMLVGYQYEKIIDKYGNKLSNGITVDYSIGTIKDETGRRLLNAYPKLDNHFLLMYGDNYWHIDLVNMLELYNKSKKEMLTTVFSNSQGTGEYGFGNNIEVGSDGIVKCYDKSGRAEGLNGVDIGYFLVCKRDLPIKIKDNISFESVIFSSLIDQKKVVGYVTENQYYFITNKESLCNFEGFAKTNKINPIDNF